MIEIFRSPFRFRQRSGQIHITRLHQCRIQRCDALLSGIHIECLNCLIMFNMISVGHRG